MVSYFMESLLRIFWTELLQYLRGECHKCHTRIKKGENSYVSETSFNLLCENCMFEKP